MIIIVIIINIVFALLLFYLTIAFITGAPFVPSLPDCTASMMHLAGIKPGMKVYDLGSGDGRLLFFAAKKGAYTTGFEINPFLVVLTHIRRLFSPYRSSIHVYWKNFWSSDLSDADVVFVYLLPWRMDELARKLKQGCRKGTVVVSNSFIFREWDIEKKDTIHHIFMFRI